MPALAGFSIGSGSGSPSPAAPATPSGGGGALAGFKIGVQPAVSAGATPTATSTPEIGPSSISNLKSANVNTTPTPEALASTTPAGPKTSGLFSNFTSLNNLSIPKQTTDSSTSPIEKTPNVTQLGTDTLASLPEGSQKVSSDINNAVIQTPADLLSKSKFIQQAAAGINAGSENGNFAADLLHRLSAGLETVTGLTGGAYQSPADQTTDAATTKAQASTKAFDDAVTAAGPQPDGPMSPALQKLATQAQKDSDDAKATGPEDLVDAGVRALSNGLGMAVAVGLGTKGLTAIPGVAGALDAFENLTSQLPLVGKYATPFVKPLLTNAAGFAAYGQLDPKLAGDIQTRTKTFMTDMAEAPIYTALGALKSPAISLPASFGLGYGMALLSGASQQQAVTSGAAFAFLDGAGRADGTRPILSQDEMYAKLTTEAQNTLSQHSGIKITDDTTAAQLKTAWRIAAHQTHPDLGGNAGDFTAAKNAYDFLTKAQTSTASTDSETQNSIKSLKGGVQKAVDTYGPENAVPIVKDELGLDNETAGKLVRGSISEPELPVQTKALQGYDLGSSTGKPSNMSDANILPETGTSLPSLSSKIETPSVDSSIRYTSPSYVNVLDRTGAADDITKYSSTAIAHGKENLEPFKQDIEQITGVTPEVQVKSPGSIAEKGARLQEAGKPLARMNDVLRSRITVPEDERQSMLDKITAHFNVLGTGDYRTKESPYGYRGINVTVKLPNGMPAEIQIHSPESLAHTNFIHPTYEKYRNEDVTKMTPERLAEHEKDAQIMRSFKTSETALPAPLSARHIPVRGFINPGAIADDIVAVTKQVGDYIEKQERSTKLTDNVNDSIYQHEGLRKANRQRAIQLLQTQGNLLTAEQWENLYHYDENSSEQITPQEQHVYDTVVKPIKGALTAARAEYRALGGHITTDLQMEQTPRYAKAKGGPIDKLLNNSKAVLKGEKSLANGGLMSKSVAGGAKHRVFHALTDETGARTVVSIPNPKTSRVTAFNKNVLTDLGPKSGKVGKTFTDENGKVYTIDQATTKEIEANTNTRYHKNVLANYVLAYDRQSNALSALKLLDNMQKTDAFKEIIMKEDPEAEIQPPADWKDLSGVMPQFRGYYAEPKLAEALEDLAKRLTGRDPIPVFDEINNFLVTSIVLNPILHVPNVAIGWATSESANASIPGISKNSAANFAKAVNEVKNKGPLYLSYIESGAPFMALKQTSKEFTEAVLTQYSNEVAENPTEHEAIAKALGYANPLAWMKGFSHINEAITWGSNDILFMHALLDHADRTGVTPEEAIKQVSKRMADYRLPSRIGPGKFGRAVSKLVQSPAFLFSRYHYSGVIKPWIEGIKDTAGPKSTFKQRREGLRALAYLGLMSLIVYPYIDKALQGMTGNKNSYITQAGATKLPQTIAKLYGAGATGIPAAINSTLALSPALYAADELGFNTDLYTRNPIYSSPMTAQDEGLGTFGVSMVAPLATATRMKPSDFALSLLGIYSPANAPGKNALDAQKYDELPALEVQVKKDEAAGLTSKANAEIKDFNDRAIANYNADMLSQGKPPLAADGSENDTFLKQWGIRAPGAISMANASKLYGDGSLTSKATLLQSVGTYAKAIGTDPVTAFNRIFTGQLIVRVDNAGILSPDSAIIVQRAPLATTEAIRQSEASANGESSQLGGLQLDHFIPLEAGGSNDSSNLDLVTTEQNEVLHTPVESAIAAALKNGQISRANAEEYLVRFKIGTLHENPNQKYVDLYKNQYGSQPITLDQINALIKSGKAK